MTCGHVNAGSWHTPLVCNLDLGHEGPHGIRQLHGLLPYVRWEDVEDEGLLSTRAQVTEQTKEKAR